MIDLSLRSEARFKNKEGPPALSDKLDDREAFQVGQELARSYIVPSSR